MSKTISGLRRGFARTVITLLILGWFWGPAAMAGEEVTVDGVLHIRNGATPSQGKETLELEELWRAGGADDEDVLFGLIVQARVADDGSIYLLDLQLSQVHVFSPDGEYVTSLSQEGDGPGEVRRPRDFLFMPDETIGILQTFPGKIIKVGRDGVPAGDIVLGGAPEEGGLIALLDANLRGGNFVVAGTTIEQVPPAGRHSNQFLAKFNEDGTEVTRYAEYLLKMDFSNFDFHERQQYFVAPGRWDLGPDGSVYTAPERNEFVINVYKPNGTLDRIIEREFKTPKRTEERMALFEAARDAQIEQLTAQGMSAKIALCEAEPAITSMNITDDGMIWVLTPAGAQAQPEGEMVTYDVFDPEGHFIKQVAIGCSGDGENDIVFPAGEDRLIKVTEFIAAAVAVQGGLGAAMEDESEPMEVICYRIVK